LLNLYSVTVVGELKAGYTLASALGFKVKFVLETLDGNWRRGLGKVSGNFTRNLHVNYLLLTVIGSAGFIIVLLLLELLEASESEALFVDQELTGGCLLKLLRDDGGALSFTSEWLVALTGNLDENLLLLFGRLAVGLVNNIASVEALSLKMDKVVVPLNLLKNFSVRELEMCVVALLPVHADLVSDERQALLLLEASLHRLGEVLDRVDFRRLEQTVFDLLCSAVSTSVALALSVHVLATRPDRLFRLHSRCKTRYELLAAEAECGKASGHKNA